MSELEGPINHRTGRINHEVLNASLALLIHKLGAFRGRRLLCAFFFLRSTARLYGAGVSIAKLPLILDFVVEFLFVLWRRNTFTSDRLEDFVFWGICITLTMFCTFRTVYFSRTHVRINMLFFF